MIVKITSKRQVTLPTRVLDTLGVGPGDHLEIEKGPDGFILRPRRFDDSRLDQVARTATTDGATRKLDLVTVKTGRTTSWNRDEIYGADGR